MITERGSILIGVLWSLFFMAGLALAINASISPQLGMAGRLNDRAVLRHLAEAGYNRAVIEIRADESEGYDALNELWSRNDEAFKEIGLTDNGYFSVEYGDGPGQQEEGEKYYGLTDEERKININTASADVLTQFFESVGGASPQEAGELTDSLIDWRDEDSEPGTRGAEDNYYQGLNPGYSCKNSPFEVLEEMLLVKGATQELFDKVKGFLTVYGEGKVNINTAGVLVLRSLGISEGLAEKIVKFREGNDGIVGTEDDNIFESNGGVVGALSAEQSLSASEIQELMSVQENGLITVESAFFRGQVIGGLRDRELTSRIVFVFDRDEHRWYWRED